jgi:hypothetical protein
LCAAIEADARLAHAKHAMTETEGVSSNAPLSPPEPAAAEQPVMSSNDRVATPSPKRPTPRSVDPTLTQLEEIPAPPGVTATQIFPATGFFSSSTDRYAEIKGSLQFFRDGLQREYEELSGQAKLTYRLWVACVALGFVVLVTGVALMFANRIAQGAVTAASTVLLYFIQRVFQQREDHYRAAAAQKHSNLEYGNQWLLVIQSIDAMENPADRAARQARLVDALTERLERGSDASPRSAHGTNKHRRSKPKPAVV